MKKSFVLPAILFCIILFAFQTFMAFKVIMIAPVVAILFIPLEVILFVQLRRVIISGATYLDGP